VSVEALPLSPSLSHSRNAEASDARDAEGPDPEGLVSSWVAYVAHAVGEVRERERGGVCEREREGERECV